MTSTMMIRAAVGATLLAGTGLSAATAQDDPYISQVTAFGFAFCPQGWANTNGQMLDISNNTTLFALIGTQFGGNGITNFAVPNLQGRMSVGQGSSSSGQSWSVGTTGGSSTQVLAPAQIPSHNHGFQATSTQGNSQDPAGRTVATFVSAAAYAPAGSSIVAMNSNSVGNTGDGTEFSVQDPILAVTMCIAVDGAWPPRP